MSLDPVTFVAQIINFLILMFLLYKVLYKPLLNAVDNREQRISDQIKQARDGLVEVESRLAEIAKKEREIDGEKNAVLDKAYKDAEDLRERLFGDVRSEISAKRALWMDELAVERKNLENELRTMIVDNFVAFSKKALTDLADTDLNERMTAVLKNKFDALPDKEKDKLKNATQAEVFTAFAATDAEKAGIAGFLKEKSGIDADQILFKQKPSLLCGIEIVANDNVLGWNLDGYLKTFADETAEALNSMAARVKNKED